LWMRTARQTKVVWSGDDGSGSLQLTSGTG
jgi:hypothetical protein